MWTDEPTDQDFVNFQDIAASIAEVLREPDLLPTSIGIFGSWGVGKSSLLKMVEQELVPPERAGEYIVLHFDAWLYQGFDGARLALMDRVVNAVHADVNANKSIASNVTDRVTALARRVNGFRALAAGADLIAMAHGMWPLATPTAAMLTNGGGTATPPDTVSEIRDFRKANAKPLLDEPEVSPAKAIHEFREDLETTLHEIDRTVIVFVDNLDRCLPQVAIETLEAIRLLLFLERTAFVIAADEDVIRQQLRRGHLNSLDERHITDYLDKLIQVAVRVPVLGLQEVRAYLYLLQLRREGASPNDIDAARSSVRKKLRSAWRGVAVEPDDVLEAITGDHSELAKRLEAASRLATLLVRPPVGGNPRLVKRLMNTVRLRSRVSRRQGIEIAEEVLAKIAIFQRCAGTDAFAALARLVAEAVDGKVAVLKSLEGGEDDAVTLPEEWQQHVGFVRHWATVAPTLGDVDLRPAIALSKEALQSVGGEHTLDEDLQDLLRALLAVTKASNRTIQERLQQTSSERRVTLMGLLIDRLRVASDWSTRVEGAIGAVALAEVDGPAAGRFLTFLSDRDPTAFGKWFRLHLERRRWAAPYRERWNLPEPTDRAQK